jgi:hypothetical protein
MTAAGNQSTRCSAQPTAAAAEAALSVAAELATQLSAAQALTQSSAVPSAACLHNRATEEAVIVSFQPVTCTQHMTINRDNEKGPWQCT